MSSNTRYKCPIGPQFSLISKDSEIKPISIFKHPIIVGLTGPTKSGKTAIAKHLVTEEGFTFYSMISPIKELKNRLGNINADWKELGEFASKFREYNSTSILADLFIEYYFDHLRRFDKIVVDGILHDEEVNTFRKAFNFFFLFYIYIEEENIRDNYVKENDVFKDFSELSERDKFEQLYRNDKNPFRPNIAKCRSLSDHEIKNKGYKWKDINNCVKEILKQINS